MCGKETDFYIGSNGVLCYKHHRRWEAADQDRVEWCKRKEEEVRDRVETLESEMRPGGKAHHSNSGNFAYSCESCSGTFYSSDPHDHGICVDCTEHNYAIGKKIRKLWDELSSGNERRLKDSKERFGM